MKKPPRCPKCGAEMQEGFIIESKLPSRWIAGPPETGILGIKASGREQRPIASYRCVACGYLEIRRSGNRLTNRFRAASHHLLSGGGEFNRSVVWHPSRVRGFFALFRWSGCAATTGYHLTTLRVVSVKASFIAKAT